MQPSICYMKQTYQSYIGGRQLLVQHIFKTTFQPKLFQVMPLLLNCDTTKNQIYQISVYFESNCYAKISNALKIKLDMTTIECIFLGYSHTSKGYKAQDVHTKAILTSRSIIFLEDSLSVQKHDILLPDPEIFSIDFCPMASLLVLTMACSTQPILLHPANLLYLHCH